MEGIARGQRHRQARSHVEHEVEADEVVEAEQPGLGDPHRPAHHRVRLLDRHALRRRLDQPRLQRVDPDPVGEETGRIAAVHHSLAQGDVAEPRQRLDDLGPRIRPAHQLQQPHEAHRIEEMGDAEIGAHRLGHAPGEQGERQRGGVGRNDGARPPHPVERVVQIAFHVDALDDRLRDPVAVAHAAEVVLDVAGGDARGVVRVHERGRGLRAHAPDRPRGGRIAVRRAGDVEQQDVDAGVGEVARDARTHGAGPDDRGPPDLHVISYSGASSIDAMSS